MLHWIIRLLLLVLLSPVVLYVSSRIEVPVEEVNVLGAVVERQASPAQPAIPARAACTYRVRYGDNLFRIGLRYGVSYQYLAAVNGIPNPHWIYAGSVLAVPCGPGGGGGTIPVTGCAPSQTYLVQPGDNLFRIAYNYRTSLDLLRARNGLYGRVLRSGVTLLVPCPGSVPYRDIGPAPSQPGSPEPTPQPPAQNTATILMQGNQFIPNAVTVKTGTTLYWVNTETDGTTHTVTSGSPGAPTNLFDSGSTPIPPGGSFSYTFNASGTFIYYSKLQLNMQGVVNVVQ